MLSQAKSLEEIAPVISDLKEQYAKDRASFWGYLKAIYESDTAKGQIIAIRELENASSNLFDSSFPEKINPLRILWGAITQNSFIRALGVTGEKLLEFDEANRAVSRIDLARRVKKDMRNIDGMNKLLSKHKIIIKDDH